MENERQIKPFAENHIALSDDAVGCDDLGAPYGLALHDDYSG